MKIIRLLFIIILITLCSYSSLKAQSWRMLSKVVASDRLTDGLFGISVSMSDKYAAIGAIGDRLNLNEGVYIFEHDSYGNWSEIQKVVSSDIGHNDEFGYSVAISDNYLIVGAYLEDEDTTGSTTIYDAGSAYIFERNGSGIWVEAKKLVASDRALGDEFGISVSISGNYAIVGAPYEDDDTLSANPIPRSGSAYIFERNPNGNWKEAQKLISSNRQPNALFGYSVSISGSTAIVGAFGDNKDTSGNSFIPTGAAYIFERDTNGTWNEVKKLVASDRDTNDAFGYSVSLSSNHIIIGAGHEDHDVAGSNKIEGAGSAYIFERNTSDGSWSEVQKLVASDRGIDNSFGSSVSIKNQYAMVSGHYNDNDTSINHIANYIPGSAYIFKRDPSGSWKEVRKLVAPDQTASGQFGYSVSITENYAIASAPTDSNDANGVSTLYRAGSAYIFGHCLDSIPYVTSMHSSFVSNPINGATYQWLDCNNSFAPIPGAINQNFTPSTNGSYAIAITYNGCTDTSECYSISNVDIEENQLNKAFNIYPNPTSSSLYLENLSENTVYKYFVCNSNGQLLLTGKLFNNSNTVDVSSLNSGLYFMKIKSDQGISTMKFIKG